MTNSSGNHGVEPAEKTLSTGTWIYFSQNAFIFWTPGLYNLLGLDPKAFAPGSLDHIQAGLSCVAPEHRSQVEEAFENCRNQGGAYEIECRIIRPSGESFWARIGASPVWQGDRFEQIMGYVVDITSQKEDEKKRIDSERFAQALLDASIESAFLIDDQGVFLAANKVTAQRLHLDMDQVVGKKCYEMFSPEVARRRQKMAQQVMDTGRAVRYEDIRDGRVLDSSIVPVVDATGRISKVAIYAKDVTEHKKALAALEKIHEQYKNMLDAIQDFVVIASPFGKLQFVNAAFCKHYGYSSDQALALSPFALIHPDYHDVFRQFHRDCQKTGRFSGEIKDVKKDGTCFMADVNGAAIEWEGRDCMLAVLRDISQRKEAESILQESREQYRSLFEENFSVMLLLDQAGNIVDANAAACRYYGYPQAKLTRMQIHEINTLSKDKILQEIKKAREEDRNYFNFSHRLSDGRVRDVEVYSGPIKRGGVSLLCSVIHDVSERRQAEKEREVLIKNLKAALDEIKTLKGIMPICSNCKKIRDDKGFWNQLESYIQQHSNASFSHGICPDCIKKLYGDLDVAGGLDFLNDE